MPHKPNPRTGSDSSAQRSAESLVLAQLSALHQKVISPRRLVLHNRAFNVDGYASDSTTIALFEVWAHIGPAKAAQKNKVLADILKLGTLARLLRDEQPHHTVHCTFVFVDEEAARVLLNKSWGALAAETLGVRIEIIPLPEAARLAVLRAQRAQDIREDLASDE